MPLTGLEPVRYRYRGILSPLCLPIPPQRREQYNYNRLLSRCQYILFCVDVSNFFDLKTIPFHISGATRRTHSASGGVFCCRRAVLPCTQPPMPSAAQRQTALNTCRYTTQYIVVTKITIYKPLKNIYKNVNNA